MGEEPLIEWIAVTIDCVNVGVVAEFWRRLLGLVRLEDPLPGWARAASAVPGGPALTFQPVPEPKVDKVRVHLDLRTGDLAAGLARIRALGGARRPGPDIPAGAGAEGRQDPCPSRPSHR